MAPGESFSGSGVYVGDSPGFVTLVWVPNHPFPGGRLHPFGLMASVFLRGDEPIKRIICMVLFPFAIHPQGDRDGRRV